MTRYVSETRLKEISKNSSEEVALVINVLLQRECEELNPWLPIDENTPKNKRLLVDFTCGLVFIARFDGKFWEIEEGSSDYYGQPIRYQELPDNQEPGDKNG